MLKRWVLFFVLGAWGGLQAATFYDVREVIRPDASVEAIEGGTCVLNGQGQVLGHAFTRSGRFVNFIWDAEQGLISLDDLIKTPGVELEEAVYVNDQGVVLGAASEAEVERPFLWNPSDGQIQWIGGSDWMALALNNHNQVLLGNMDDAGYTIWDKGEKPIHISVSESLWPRTMNDRAQVLFWEFSGYGGFAVWQKGKIVRRVNGSRQFLPLAITLNNHGDVVGELHDARDTDDETPPVALIWHHDGSKIQLSQKGQYLEVADINDQLEVVGQDRSVEGQRVAFVWSTEEGLVYLKDRISSDWVLEDALAINEKGQILAVGHLSGEAEDVLVLLTPAD
jgi:uncharacterized membrane protein